ncbi:MAG: ABC transporter ATP-binding protein [Pseudomonadota bacterium]
MRLLRDAGLAHWRGFALAFVMMGVMAGMTALSAWIMRDVINGIFVDGRGDLVLPISAAIAAIFAIKGAATFANTVILNRIGSAIIAGLQMRIFRHVLTQRVDFFESMTIADVATKLGHNARAARQAIHLVVVGLGRDLLTVIALTLVMILQNPGLSLIALIAVPPTIFGLGRLVDQIKKVARAELKGLSKIIATVQETGGGMRIVKAFGLERRMERRMQAVVDDLRKKADSISAISAAPIPLVETIAGLAIAGVVFYAGSQVASGSADPGAFFSFLTAMLLAYDPARRVAQLNVVLHAHMVGVEAMYRLLDAPPRIEEHPQARALPEGPGQIVFDSVHFRYDPRTGPQEAAPVPVAAGVSAQTLGAEEGIPLMTAPAVPGSRREPAALEGLDLVAEAGRVTALVGPSGAGKSTVVQLIERFFDPEAGRVLIDGHDVARVTLRSLRGRIAYVSQETFLFEGTVAENIALGQAPGSPRPSREAILAAARTANADGFIMALPQGYDTRLGENGAQLSGGQRQRLAIARAVLRDPRILLLDEPTSALDAESEAHVSQALTRLMAGRTTLVIAHRLSTVRHADRIHVIDGGRVIQSGTHEELLAAGGLYARLHLLQFGTEMAEADAPSA